MLCFLDDLNMPAHDTFGSQPPLELLRFWIDYGFWYDRQKQTLKYVKVRSDLLRKVELRSVVQYAARAYGIISLMLLTDA